MNRALRIYISGPITGMPKLNRPAFEAAAEQIRAAGFLPVNPFELIDQDRAAREGWQWSDYMRVDIAALCECDAIVLLDGWMLSDGAQLEQRIASALGMPKLTRTMVASYLISARAAQFLPDQRMNSVRRAIARASDLMMAAEAKQLAEQILANLDGAA